MLMEEIDFSKVGLKMKQLRSEQGMTQEKVAEELACTVAFISNIENNRAKLNLRVLLYYANLCSVSVDTLLNAGRPGTPFCEDDMTVITELHDALKCFSLEDRKKILKMLRIWNS